MTLATSDTHPLHVDVVPLDGVAGRLGVTFAPGKRGAGAVSRVVWDRDLGADLATLRDDYGTDVLLSLIEDHELDLLGIPDLVQRAEAAGIDVRRFPIRDVSVPRRDQAIAFDAEVERAYGDLVAGKNVTVHCRGGRGRAGLAAACLVVRHGASARDAIARVRAARRGAIETVEQERFVETFAARVVTP